MRLGEIQDRELGLDMPWQKESFRVTSFLINIMKIRLTGVCLSF